MSDQVPVITIDGPSGSGKGTIARLVAEQLGWRVLDSGALYRLVGHAAHQAGVAFDKENKISDIASKLKVDFDGSRIRLNGADVTDLIRTEHAGEHASRVAAMPGVRAALLDWQREYAKPPGLVADGRDMGTTVFPRAGLKVFLTASPAERAERRYKQLKEKGLPANLAALTTEIEARDERDRSREASPLLAASDAIEIDSTALEISDVVDRVLREARRVFATPI
jgi:cytidylate kinase